MPKIRRRWVVRLVKVVVVIALVVFAGVVFNSYLDPFDDQPFDHVAWAAAEEHERERGPMARGAIRHIPPGTSAERVRELLGEPQIIPAGGDRWGVQPRSGECWSYSIGSWSAIGPYGFDAAFVYVHFDRDGKVVSAVVDGG